ncbi:MAG: GTPase [Clostridia bacterium]|nr:GTPase [Clostridia bacterium]
MKRFEMPVFVINGFLESGKTSFIKNVIMQDQFSDFKRILLIQCEEGEILLEQSFLDEYSIFVETIEEEQLRPDYLKLLQKKHNPWAVIIEYNAMWKAIRLDETKLPDRWEIYQTITTADASTFEVYRNNMKSIAAEILKNVDMVLFNRCREDMNLSSYRRSAKALSSGVQVIFEHENGSIMPLAEQLPYDIQADFIQVEDDDFGIWYLDMMERPESYTGKTVSFTGRVARLKRSKDGFFAAGRMVMTCCADDLQFLGFVCQYEDAEFVNEGEWIHVKAKITFTYRPEYRREGPLLVVDEIKAVKAPLNECISL